MSSGPELGEVAYTSPVEGLMMSSVSPDAAGRSSPLMMLEKTFLSAMSVPFSHYWFENPIIAQVIFSGYGRCGPTSRPGHRGMDSGQRSRRA